MRAFTLALILFPLIVLSDDRRLNTAQLKIMTFNAEFLWDGILPEEGQVHFPWKGAPDEAQEHMADIADIIVQNNPDIVNLVEVEGLAALKILNDKFLSGRGYRPYLVKGKDSYTGQDVGILTRVDPIEIKRWDIKGQSGNTKKNVSKNYYAKFKIGNQKIALIGLHFLARPNAQNRRHPRQAQANAIAKLVKNLNAQHYQTVVLGDFNDYDDQVRDNNNNQPITQVLSMIKAAGTQKKSDDLINVAQLLPNSLRYTAHWDRDRDDIVDGNQELSAIDHILIDPKLFTKVVEADIPHNHDPIRVSDHFPVTVTLSLGKENRQKTSLKIKSVLPNPVGDERANEQVSISNMGNRKIDLAGWKLRDKAKRTWDLSSMGVINPGMVLVIKRNHQPMALNNSGDTVDLVDSQDALIDSISYTEAEEGELYEF